LFAKSVQIDDTYLIYTIIKSINQNVNQIKNMRFMK